MEIKSLQNIELETIVECMSASFKNYFVKIPTEVEFWKSRYEAARVDYNLSYGAFDGNLLTGFVIHGIDQHDGQLTAFNTGTGVLSEYRGRKIVDQIYDHAFPLLKSQGVEKCMLEVIDENHVAIRVYERIGFAKDRFLRCFHGELEEKNINVSLKEVSFSDIKPQIEKFQPFYSWDHSWRAVEKSGNVFKTYIVQGSESSTLGYFVINTKNGAFVQLEAFDEAHWETVLHATRGIHKSFRINNIDDRKKTFIDTMLDAGIKNHVNQFEMTLPI